MICFFWIDYSLTTQLECLWISGVMPHTIAISHVFSCLFSDPLNFATTSVTLSPGVSNDYDGRQLLCDLLGSINEH